MCCNVPLPLEITLDAVVRAHWQSTTEDLVLTYRTASPAASATTGLPVRRGGAQLAHPSWMDTVPLPLPPGRAT